MISSLTGVFGDAPAEFAERHMSVRFMAGMLNILDERVSVAELLYQACGRLVGVRVESVHSI